MLKQKPVKCKTFAQLAELILFIFLTLTARVSSVYAISYGEGKFGTSVYSPTSTPTPAATSSSSNPSVSSSSPSSVCNDEISRSAPDLFEIRTDNQSATLFFAPPPRPYSSFYIAYSRKSDSWEYGVEYNQGYSGGVLSYKINLLQPNTQYRFSLRAGNGCTTGPWSRIITAQTSSSPFRQRISYKNLKTALAARIKKSVPSIMGSSSPPSITPAPLPSPLPSPPSSPSPKKKCFLFWCF